MFAFDVLENTRTTFFKILKKTQIPEKPLKNDFIQTSHNL